MVSVQSCPLGYNFNVFFTAVILKPFAALATTSVCALWSTTLSVLIAFFHRRQPGSWLLCHRFPINGWGFPYFRDIGFISMDLFLSNSLHFLCSGCKEFMQFLEILKWKGWWHLVYCSVMCFVLMSSWPLIMMSWWIWIEMAMVDDQNLWCWYWYQKRIVSKIRRVHECYEELEDSCCLQSGAK